MVFLHHACKGNTELGHFLPLGDRGRLSNSISTNRASIVQPRIANCREADRNTHLSCRRNRTLFVNADQTTTRFNCQTKIQGLSPAKKTVPLTLIQRHPLINVLCHAATFQTIRAESNVAASKHTTHPRAFHAVRSQTNKDA